MASSGDIKNGLCMMHKGKPVTVIEFQHVKPGKGPAFVRTKLKNIETGRVVDHTFPSGHKIDVIRVENRTYQYLYKEDDGYHVMNTSTYEQTFIAKHLVANPEFLVEG